MRIATVIYMILSFLFIALSILALMGAKTAIDQVVGAVSFGFNCLIFVVVHLGRRIIANQARMIELMEPPPQNAAPYLAGVRSVEGR